MCRLFSLRKLEGLALPLLCCEQRQHMLLRYFKNPSFDPTGKQSQAHIAPKSSAQLTQ